MATRTGARTIPRGAGHGGDWSSRRRPPPPANERPPRPPSRRSPRSSRRVWTSSARIPPQVQLEPSRTDVHIDVHPRAHAAVFRAPPTPAAARTTSTGRGADGAGPPHHPAGRAPGGHPAPSSIPRRSCWPTPSMASTCRARAQRSDYAARGFRGVWRSTPARPATGPRRQAPTPAGPPSWRRWRQPAPSPSCCPTIRRLVPPAACARPRRRRRCDRGGVQSAQINADDHEFCFNLAVLLGDQGDADAEIEWLQQTLKVKPDFFKGVVQPRRLREQR